LTVNPGTWDAGTTFTYQWYGNLILTGQTGQSFTLRSSEKGVSVYVIMKATNGFATVSKTITTSGPVAAGTLTVGNATFYGDLVVGGQLYRTDGTWTPGTTLTYQWLSNGNPIVGQTSYMMYAGVATLGTSISLRVTGTLAGYNTASVTTAAQGPIGLGTIGSWSIGTVTGGTLDPNTGKTRAKTGDVLGMSKASWCATNLSTATTITYQWTRNGTAVAGQTGVTYTVTNADSGAQVGYTTYCASTGYTTRSWATPTMEILQAPTLPTITSIDQSQVTSLRVNFNGVAGNTNTFAIVYSATNKQSPKICDTNSCTFNNLSGSTTYTIEYTATASGGSISGTTTATTYPRLTLNATINSFTKQGDKWTVTYQPISTWTYEFVWETYGLGTSGCTNGTAGVTTQSPISVFANIRTGCQKALRVLDGHGNSADVLLDYYTTVAVPAMSLTGSLASSTATLDANVTFNYSVTSYYAYATRTLVLLNSAGTSVTLAIAPTVARISGDTYNGAYQGTLYLTGVAAGSYTVRLTISDSSGASSTVVLGALTVG
jgi:hypothetical protein